MKTTLIIISLLLVAGVIFLASDIKDAYKVLPIGTPDINPDQPFDFTAWKDFSAKADKFKNKFPSTPQYAVDSVAIPGTDKKRLYEMYVAEKLDGAVFMVSIVSYPADFSTNNSQQMLHDAVDEMMQTKPNNRLKSIEDTQFQGYPAVDFNITKDDFNVKGKGVIVDKMLYLLTYVQKAADFNEAEYQHFFNEFHLPKQTAKK